MIAIWILPFLIVSQSATSAFQLSAYEEESFESALAVGLGLVASASVSVLDKPINDLSKELKLNELGEILSLPGDGYFILPFTLAGYLSGVLFKDDKLEFGFLQAGISLAFTTTIVQIIKFSGRLRPYASPSESPYKFSFPGLKSYNRSFPSGHSQASASVYITVGNNICKSVFCKVSFFTLPFIVAAGRILTQDHWFSDVVGGIIIGSSFQLF